MKKISELDWQIRLDKFRADLADAHKEHSTSIMRYSNTGDPDDRLIFVANATTRLCMDVARASERMGAIGAVDQLRERILAFWNEAPEIDLGVAGERIAAVSVAYSDMSFVGNGRMINALFYAALLEFGDEVALDVDLADQRAQTIAKSLSRLRKKMQGKSGLRFDPASLLIKKCDLSAVLFSDLPSGRGRPAKPK